jgi:carbon monoxide dehydrogenase subunit G
MLQKILIGVVVVIILFVIVVATRPAAFKIERSETMSAPPEVVFAQINDLHKWSGWSPWEKLDPEMKRTYEGAPSGTGAIYTWSGNSEAGEGKMTIEKSEKSAVVVIKLEFIRPFAAVNMTTFTLTPAGATTKVTWSMEGERNFGQKAAALFIDLEKLVGGDFERGLAAMKTVSEAAAKSTPSP